MPHGGKGLKAGQRCRQPFGYGLRPGGMLYRPLAARGGVDRRGPEADRRGASLQYSHLVGQRAVREQDHGGLLLGRYLDRGSAPYNRNG